MAVQIERRAVPDVGEVAQLPLDDGRQVDVVVPDGGGRTISMRDGSSAVTATLSEEQADALADLLASPHARDSVLREPVAGLLVVRLVVPPKSWLVGHPLHEAHIYEKTGASVLAIMRASEAQPMPRPDFSLLAGDELLVSGTREAVADAGHILDGTG